MPFGIDILLPSLLFAPALTALTIEANCSPEDLAAARVLPSFALIDALLRAQPDLRLEIRLLHHTSPLQDEYVPTLAANFAAVPADV